jgi:hypothetical protein
MMTYIHNLSMGPHIIRKQTLNINTIIKMELTSLWTRNCKQCCQIHLGNFPNLFMMILPHLFSKKLKLSSNPLKCFKTFPNFGSQNFNWTYWAYSYLGPFQKNFLIKKIYMAQLWVFITFIILNLCMSIIKFIKFLQIDLIKKKLFWIP